MRLIGKCWKKLRSIDILAYNTNFGLKRNFVELSEIKLNRKQSEQRIGIGTIKKKRFKVKVNQMSQAKEEKI